MSAPVNIREGIFYKYKRDYLFHFSRILNKAMVQPDMLQLMVTSRCQLKCKMCNVWKEKFQENARTEDLKKLIDEAISMGIETIYFTGGEALLRNDIFELIDYAARPGIITTMNTNGAFIDKKTAEVIVRSKLRHLSFSIDGANPRTHDFLRGKGVFKRAMRAIGYINYYKKKYGRLDNSQGTILDIGMVSVIMKTNLQELPALADLAKKIGCCYIAFQPLVNNRNLSAPLENSELWIEEKDIPELERILEVLSNKKKAFSGLMHIDVMVEKTVSHFRGGGLRNTCFAGFNRVFVNPLGIMSFVCFEPFGYIQKDNLKEVWYKEDTDKIRAKIRDCKKSCTQFCSERSPSDDILDIHGRLKDEIRSLSLLQQKETLEEERSFLCSIKDMFKPSNLSDDGRNKTVNALEQILSSEAAQFD